jgi:hypothetical protein
MTDGRPRPLRAGQELLRMVRVYKNADASPFSSYSCIRNMAIWMNGTEVVHERWNNITTVNSTNNGTMSYGSLLDGLDMAASAGGYGVCPANGIWYL